MAFEPRYDGVVERVAYGGQGVVRLDGFVVFVPGVLPGEKIRFRIRSDRRTYAQGELLEVLEAAPGRRPPECPLMTRPRGLGPEAISICPGCAYGHMTYERELELKQEQFEEVLSRLGGLKKVVCQKPIGAPRPLQYRNKLVLHAQKDSTETTLGYLGVDNRTVLDIPACPLAVPPLNELLATLRAKPGFFQTLRHDMDVTLRWTERDGALFWRGEPEARDPWLLEATPAGPLLVPRDGFFQVNPWSAALLIETVQAVLRQAKPGRFVDLYCGAGLFSLAAARCGIETGIGLDADPAVIAAATQNALRHGLAGFSFQALSAEQGIGSALEGGPAASTLLLVDPPRTGLDLAVTSAIAAAKPKDVVYVSCSADTLARDLARLALAGYQPKRLQLVDMFPRTAHFEAVVWLRQPGRTRAPAKKTPVKRPAAKRAPVKRAAAKRKPVKKKKA
jgi:23S rRNA (uracil1939-C5)-methyltransferase